MIIGLTIGDALAFAFGISLTALSLYFVYQWSIKPERERRRQDAWTEIEAMHRKHRDQHAQRFPRQLNVNIRLRPSQNPIKDQDETYDA